MNCLIIVGPSIIGRREGEVKIRIRTYSDSITLVRQSSRRDRRLQLASAKYYRGLI